MIISLGLSTITSKFNYSDEVIKVMSSNKNKTSPLQRGSFVQRETVNISPQAREKLAQENQVIGKDLAQQINNNLKSEETNKKENTSPIDSLIKQIQAQIKALKEEIRALKNNDAEAAIKQRKALENQLIAYNSTLMDLLGKKMDEVKA